MSFERIERLWTTRGAEVAKVASAVLLIGLVVWLWGYREATNVAAQSSTVVWSEPILLSDPESLAHAPTVATDMAGNVHVMWGQTKGREEQPALFYTRWNGEEWSPPLDVLISPQGDSAGFPDLAVAPDGTLHAVWGTSVSGELMYAHALACCADDARNWSQPVSLGMPVTAAAALVAGARGRLHAAFASLETGNVVYRRSDDGGATWPVWVVILGEMHQGDEYTGYPRLAVDGRGRVHAVWSVLPWPGRLVMYARSDDGGDNWSEPQVIDSVYYGHYATDRDLDYGPIFIDVEAFGEDEVHLIWDGAPTVERTHIWSFDGGETWSEPSLLIPELTGVGRQGYNDMVVDSAGTLHAVALGAPYHASWSAGRWSPSTVIAQHGASEFMRIAQGLGNHLHVVWLDYAGLETQTVWYVQGETSTPAGAVQALPTAPARPLPTPTLVARSTVMGATVTEPAIPTMSAQPESGNTTSSNPMSAVLMGVIPALLLMSSAFVVKIQQARRRQRN